MVVWVLCFVGVSASASLIHLLVPTTPLSLSIPTTNLWSYTTLSLSSYTSPTTPLSLSTPTINLWTYTTLSLYLHYTTACLLHSCFYPYSLPLSYHAPPPW